MTRLTWFVIGVVVTLIVLAVNDMVRWNNIISTDSTTPRE